MPAGSRAAAFILLLVIKKKKSHAVTSSYMTMKGRPVKHLTMQKKKSSLQNIDKQTTKSRCRQTEGGERSGAGRGCLLTMNYLEQRTPD